MQRTKFLATLLFPSLLALMLGGCLEIESTSHVNTDGTILRTVTIEGDSGAIHRGDFPLPLDSTWDRKIQKAGSDKFVLTATRLFRDVEEMNGALKGTVGKTLGVTAELQRQFQWFFTTFRYRETWLNFNPFKLVPITDYISPTELTYSMRHELQKEPYPTKGDSLAQEDASERLEKWHARNLFEAYFQTFIDGARKLGDKTLTPELVTSVKEKLFERSQEYLDGDKIDTLPVVFERVLRTAATRKVFALNSEGFKLYESQLNYLDDLMKNSYQTNIVMPGLIVQTNALSLDGAKASWEDYVKFGFLTDIDLTVESRVTNWWAITVTGILVAAILIVLVLAVIRRRRIV